jgi:hypothetical protein
MIKEVKFFGNKNTFSIELGFTKSPNKYYLRFWFENLPMGDFRKSGELEFAKKTYENIKKNKLKLVVPIFDQMTANEIFSYCRKLDFDNPNDAKKYHEIESIFKLSIFGNQFTNTQSYSLVLYQEDSLVFVWQNDFGKSINHAKVKFELFCNVFDQFIEFSLRRRG